MKTELKAAITQLSAERNLSKEIVLAALESALASAYKKSMSALEQDVVVKVDPESGEINFYVQKAIVDAVTNPNRELSIKEARKMRATAQLGDVISRYQTNTTIEDSDSNSIFLRCLRGTKSLK
jgi:N utilization substance protein A